MEGDDERPKPLWHTVAAIAGLSFGTGLLALDGGIATVALPTIGRDLGVDGSRAVLVVTLYQMVFVLGILPFAALGDRIGLRRLYRAGQILFVAASGLALLAHSLPTLLGVRVLQGLGAAACLSVNSALIRSLYRPEHLGRGLGLNSIIVSSSAALAPSAGGLLLRVADWPWLFALAAPLGLVSLALGRFLPDPPPRVAPFDLSGAALTAAAVGGTVAGLELASHDDLLAGLAVLALAVLAGVVLVPRERRVPNPVLPVDLLGRRVIAISAAAAAIVFVAQMSVLVSLPFRLEAAYHLQPHAVGLLLAAWPLTTLVVAPLAGVLSDRVHPGLLGGVGLAVATLGLLLVAFLPATASGPAIAWRIGLCGFGFALFMSPNARLIIGAAPLERAAAAGGLVSTVRLVGQTLGASAAAAMLSLGLGNGRTPALIAAALTALGAVASLARLRQSAAAATVAAVAD